jgi:hypothetical protein
MALNADFYCLVIFAIRMFPVANKLVFRLSGG